MSDHLIVWGPWRKAEASGDTGDCVETAVSRDRRRFGIRDSKNTSQRLVFAAATGRSLFAALAAEQTTPRR